MAGKAVAVALLLLTCHSGVEGVPSADVHRLAAAAAHPDAPPDSGNAPDPHSQPDSRMTNGRETVSGIVSWCLQAYI